jgi:hypothetical protein
MEQTRFDYRAALFGACSDQLSAGGVIHTTMRKNKSVCLSLTLKATYDLSQTTVVPTCMVLEAIGLYPTVLTGGKST